MRPIAGFWSISIFPPAEFVQMMTAKWTGLTSKTKNQSNVSLTSYCKNLHLFILFCIDNLNWMLENWKSVHINKLKKGKRQKEKILNESACTGLYSPPPPPPKRRAAQSDLNSLAKRPLRSRLVWPLLLCFLVPSAWCHDDYMGWPIAFLLRLPVFLFFCSSCMQL